MKTHCINLSSHESLGFVNKRVSIIWRPVHNPTEYKRHTIAPQEERGDPKKHDAPYVDAYCSEKKTLENPRGMSRNWHWWDEYDRCGDLFAVCPYQPGDVLIGREAWQIRRWISDGGEVQVFYKADPPDKYWSLPVLAHEYDYEEAEQWVDRDFEKHVMCLPSCRLVKDDDVEGGERYEWDNAELSWRSAATMPRWAARHRHVIKSVSVKRCQDVTEQEAMASGVHKVKDCCYVIKGDPSDRAGICHTSPWTPFALMMQRRHPKQWDANDWMWRYEVEEAT